MAVDIFKEDVDTGVVDSFDVTTLSKGDVADHQLSNILKQTSDEADYIDKGVGALDVIEQDINQLSQIRDVVDGSLSGEDPEGISNVANEMLITTLNNIHKKYKIKNVGTESLQRDSVLTGSLRVKKSKVALESVGKTLKALWEKFIKLVKDLWKWAIDGLKAMDENVDAIDLKLKMVNDLIATLDKKTLGGVDGEVTYPKELINVFTRDGNLSPKAIVDVIKRHIEVTGFITDLNKDIESWLGDYSVAVSDSLKNGTTTDLSFPTPSFAKRIKSDGSLKQVGDGWIIVDSLVESSWIVVDFEGQDKNVLEVYTTGPGKKVTLDKGSDFVLGESEVTRKIITVEDMTKISGSIDMLMFALKDIEGPLKKSQKTVDRLIENLNTSINALETQRTEIDTVGSVADERAKLEAIVKAFKDLSSVTPWIVKQITALDLKLASRALKYLDLNIKAYAQTFNKNKQI